MISSSAAAATAAASDSPQTRRRFERHDEEEEEELLHGKNQCMHVDMETISSSTEDHVMSSSSSPPPAEDLQSQQVLLPPLSLCSPTAATETESMSSERPARSMRTVHWGEERGPVSERDQTIVTSSLVIVEPDITPTTTTMHSSTSLLSPMLTANASVDLFSTRRGSLGFSKIKEHGQTVDGRSTARSGRPVLKRKPEMVLSLLSCSF